MTDIDKELIRELRFGDKEKALEGIIVNYYDTLVRRARRHLKKSRIVEAEDIVQDVLRRVLERDWQNTEIDSLQGYLGMMVFNEIRAIFRGEKKVLYVQLPFDLEAPIEVDKEAIENLTEKQIKDVLWDFVRKGILLRSDYLVLYYRFIENMPPREIAKNLGRTPGSISASLSQAKTKIQIYCEHNGSPFDRLGFAMGTYFIHSLLIEFIVMEYKPMQSIRKSIEKDG